MPSSKKSAFKAIKILITSGPTSVPIDDMRVITNRSTGEMGRLLARALVKKNARITLLEGAVTTSQPLPEGITVRKFLFFDELHLLLTQVLRQKFDIIIHAAAVSDFALRKPLKGKISSNDEIKLTLKPTPKLIEVIKKLAPKSILIGFKFESDIQQKASINKAFSLLNYSGCAYVVLNENNTNGYKACICSERGIKLPLVRSKNDLIQSLLKEICL